MGHDDKVISCYGLQAQKWKNPSSWWYLLFLKQKDRFWINFRVVRDYLKWIVLWYLSSDFVSNYPIIFRNNLFFYNILLLILLWRTLFLHRCTYASYYGLGAQNTGGAQEMLACCITTCGIVPPLSKRRLSSLSVVHVHHSTYPCVLDLRHLPNFVWDILVCSRYLIGLNLFHIG